ncbi:MAG: serine hydrolase, partial [Bacteroidetes bacterium]
KDTPLTAAASGAALGQKLASLTLPVAEGATSSAVAAAIQGKSFILQENKMGMKAVSFSFEGNSCILSLTSDTQTYRIRSGMGAWVEGKTLMPGAPPSLFTQYNIPEKPLRVVSSAAWKDPQTLSLTCLYVETPHHDKLSCVFEGNNVKVTFLNSISAMSGPDRPDFRPVLEGTVAG